MITGRCMCGSVRFQADGDILWAALCHCEDCQRAASSDYVSWLGVLQNVVSWEGERQFFKSSPKVTRSFCGTCGSPMSFETEVFPDETHLYAASLDDRSIFRPQGHIFWRERVPWFEGIERLTRHERGLQSAALEGDDLGLKQ